MMTTQQFYDADAQYVAQTYARFPLALVKGAGATCWDADGKAYIDFTSGIGVNSLGFCDAGWVVAVTQQAASLQHTSNLYYTEPYIRAARLLCEKTGMKKVFFANSGAEANEGAIKAARKYSFDKYGAGRSGIVTLTNSFHGRTVTTLAATGQDAFHNYFYPFTDGFTYAEANDIAALEAKIDDQTCAVMLELVQGEGGVIALEKAYVQAVARICTKRDILLIVDEVQTGIGRTGTLYAYEQFGVRPDLVTSAKGLGGGLPLGAVLFGAKTESVFGAGDHATTYGGNPIACAGAAYILEKMNDTFLATVRQKGTFIRDRLCEMPHVNEVSGLGMMLGVTLDETTGAKDVLLQAMNNGVLVLTAKNKLRLLPPLNIGWNELETGLMRLKTALIST